jgi:hypothetical protein
LDTSSPPSGLGPSIRRLAPPLLCELIGILAAIGVGYIPRSYSSVMLSVFLIIFIIAHTFWFHTVIQSLRQDLKKSVETSKGPSSLPSAISFEDQHTHDVMAEASFFQLSLDRLNIPAASYIQAHCIQDDKPQLLQTESLVPLLRDNQIEILTEPIVNLPQKRLMFFFCIPCVTVDNGMLINLNTLSVASSHLSFNQAVDRMVLFQTLQFIRRHHVTHPNHGFVCYLSPTIYKDHECLEEICDFLHKSHFPFQALIFDIPLDIAEPVFKHLSQLNHYGVRFMGKWQEKPLPENLEGLLAPSMDFIMLPYYKIFSWLKGQPRRQSLEFLQQALESASQIIISHVSQEQELYHNLPLPFNYASGNAFGLPKPFYHIQI